MALTTANLYDLIDWGGDNSNLDAGMELVINLEESRDVLESLELARGDGAIDGAFFALYHRLLDSCFLHHVPAVVDCDVMGAFRVKDDDGMIPQPVQTVTTVDVMKLVMYYCFVLGSETMKQSKELEALWSKGTVDEPEREKKDGLL